MSARGGTRPTKPRQRARATKRGFWTDRRMTQICLRVSGIVCDGCRTLVEAALRDAEKDGARSTFQWSECEGFPDTGDVLLHSEASTDDLIAAVKATGRECATVEPAVWRTTRLKVGGMTCGHCSGLVERTLAAVEGVASASVDLAAAQATVVGTASAEVLVAAVAAAGSFEVEVIDVVVDATRVSLTVEG